MPLPAAAAARHCCCCRSENVSGWALRRSRSRSSPEGARQPGRLTRDPVRGPGDGDTWRLTDVFSGCCCCWAAAAVALGKPGNPCRCRPRRCPAAAPPLPCRCRPPPLPCRCSCHRGSCGWLPVGVPQDRRSYAWKRCSCTKTVTQNVLKNLTVFLAILLEIRGNSFEFPRQNGDATTLPHASRVRVQCTAILGSTDSEDDPFSRWKRIIVSVRVVCIGTRVRGIRHGGARAREYGTSRKPYYS